MPTESCPEESVVPRWDVPRRTQPTQRRRRLACRSVVDRKRRPSSVLGESGGTRQHSRGARAGIPSASTRADPPPTHAPARPLARQGRTAGDGGTASNPRRVWKVPTRRGIRPLDSPPRPHQSMPCREKSPRVMRQINRSCGSGRAVRRVKLLETEVTAGWAGGGGGFTSRHHARHRIPAPRASLNTATPQLRVLIFFASRTRRTRGRTWRGRLATACRSLSTCSSYFLLYCFTRTTSDSRSEARSMKYVMRARLRPSRSLFSTTRQRGFPGDFSSSLSPEERAGEQMVGHWRYCWAATRDERCGAALLATLGPRSGVVPATLARATCT